MGDFMTASRLLWEAAGRPLLYHERDASDVVDYDGLCWLCGATAPGLGRNIRCLPATFGWPLKPAAETDHLCICCAWTMCDRVVLPSEYAAGRLRMKALTGRRQVLSVRGGPIERVLILELADGRVGLWEPAQPAAAEKPWQAEIKSLRTDPRDVGPCLFREAVPYSDLSTGPVEKFRAYHHFGRLGDNPVWWVCTDSDRMAIREWLCSPPSCPWVGVIGDGKKHHVSHAHGAVNDGESALCSVWMQGAMVLYEPDELIRQIASVEALIVAGASDVEITTGHYASRGIGLALARREHDPVIDLVRGSATIDLLMYLRKSRKELGC